MSIHYLYDEMCVAAAFLKIPCIYGVPAGSLQTQAKKRNNRILQGEIARAEQAAIHLQDRVMMLVKQMEKKGLLLVEPGGRVRMEESLYHALNCMGCARRMGYVTVMTSKENRRIYLYYCDGCAVFQEADGKGGAAVHMAESMEKFLNLWRLQWKDAEQTAMSALLFEKQGTFYEPVLDGAWEEVRDWGVQYGIVGEILWKGRSNLCRT